MLISELNKKALDVLKNTFGYSSYRYEQEKIINSVLSGNHTLAIMPTGAGKSLCYQIPAIISSKKGGLQEVVGKNGLIIKDVNSKNISDALRILTKENKTLNFYQKLSWDNF